MSLQLFLLAITLTSPIRIMGYKVIDMMINKKPVVTTVKAKVTSKVTNKIVATVDNSRSSIKVFVDGKEFYNSNETKNYKLDALI